MFGFKLVALWHASFIRTSADIWTDGEAGGVSAGLVSDVLGAEAAADSAGVEKSGCLCTAELRRC